MDENNEISSVKEDMVVNNGQYADGINSGVGVTAPVEIKNGTVRNSKKQFLFGALAGAGVMFVVAAVLVIVLLNVFRARLVNDNSHASSSNGDSVSETVLDEATLTKLEDILGYFDALSILELDTQKFQRALIDGLVSGSGDKYAQYYDQDEIADLMGDYGGKFFGIGATLSLNTAGYAEVQGVYSNSPAERAGVREGDIITKVNGTDIYGMTLEEIVALVRGDKGTEVVLTIARDGEKDYIDLTPIRDEITVVVVEYEMKEDNIGFIHIEQWYDTTSEQFAKAMDDLRSQGMKGLVIDVRSNTGGLLRAVVAVCRQMLPEGIIVYTEDNVGGGSEYTSDGTHEIDIPVVILTNGYTASASEILTGAMKDHGKAVTIGTKTYGKGVVQSFYSFSDGTAMKLTTEQYFTPNGTAIDGIGIAPDIEVEFDSDAYYDTEDPHDNQLEAAIEYLKGKI